MHSIHQRISFVFFLCCNFAIFCPTFLHFFISIFSTHKNLIFLFSFLAIFVPFLVVIISQLSLQLNEFIYFILSKNILSYPMQSGRSVFCPFDFQPKHFFFSSISLCIITFCRSQYGFLLTENIEVTMVRIGWHLSTMQLTIKCCHQWFLLFSKSVTPCVDFELLLLSIFVSCFFSFRRKCVNAKGFQSFRWVCMIIRMISGLLFNL